jgi:hypothetical protein
MVAGGQAARTRVRSPHDFGLRLGTTAKQAGIHQIGFQLLSEKFSLTELQGVYEAILHKKLNKRNCRPKTELLNILKLMSEYRRGGQRSARLYRFGGVRFEKLKDRGILFPF